MIPTGERFDGHDSAPGQRNLRLEVSHQFPPEAGSPQVLDDSSLGNWTHGQ